MGERALLVRTRAPCARSLARTHARTHGVQLASRDGGSVPIDAVGVACASSGREIGKPAVAVKENGNGHGGGGDAMSKNRKSKEQPAQQREKQTASGHGDWHGALLAMRQRSTATTTRETQSDPPSQPSSKPPNSFITHSLTQAHAHSLTHSLTPADGRVCAPSVVAGAAADSGERSRGGVGTAAQHRRIVAPGDVVKTAGDN